MKKEMEASLKRLTNRDESLYSILYTSAEGKHFYLERLNLDRKDIRLATQNKIPIVGTAGWTENYLEEKTMLKLIQTKKEWGIRTGRNVGNYYLSISDFDFSMFSASYQKRLLKNLRVMLNWNKISNIDTRRGFHIYNLTEEPMPNATFYHLNKFGKKETIGSLQSQGRQAQGVGSENKTFGNNGHWYWKTKGCEAFREGMAKCHFLTEFSYEENEEKKENKNKTSSDSVIVKVKKVLTIEVLDKKENYWPTKVVYQDEKSTKKCFIINTYQKKFSLYSLSNSRVKLIRGHKVLFFSRKL